jgi:hypothetical protein
MVGEPKVAEGKDWMVSTAGTLAFIAKPKKLRKIFSSCREEEK